MVSANQMSVLTDLTKKVDVLLKFLNLFDEKIIS
jgi:hypothetical protein